MNTHMHPHTGKEMKARASTNTHRPNSVYLALTHTLTKTMMSYKWKDRAKREIEGWERNEKRKEYTTHTHTEEEG